MMELFFCPEAGLLLIIFLNHSNSIIFRSFRFLLALVARVFSGEDLIPA